MTFLEAAVLGITQGITEFLPISSDGHLIMVPALFGWERFGLGFDVVLHAGTLIATIAYFRHDLVSIIKAVFSRAEDRAPERRLGWFVAAATVPSVIVALSAEPLVDSVEDLGMTAQVGITAIFLLVTAALLAGSELLGKRVAARAGGQLGVHDLPLWKALVIGFAQGFAVAPGLSRSGTTIATGLALGMDREQSARFSFLLSVPIVFAALSKKILLDVVLGDAVLPPLPVTLVGVLVTTLVGYGAISFLLPFVRKHSLTWFAAYTAVLGAGILVAQAVNG